MDLRRYESVSLHLSLPPPSAPNKHDQVRHTETGDYTSLSDSIVVGQGTLSPPLSSPTTGNSQLDPRHLLAQCALDPYPLPALPTPCPSPPTSAPGADRRRADVPSAITNRETPRISMPKGACWHYVPSRLRYLPTYLPLLLSPAIRRRYDVITQELNGVAQCTP